MIRQRKNQKGLASIVIVMVMVLLLTLISVGFARLMNRALSNSFNNQLSSAANYAAQSGINDAIGLIQANLQENPPNYSAITSSTCSAKLGTGDKHLINPNFAPGTEDKYTCILINPEPKDLQYQSIPQNSSQVIKATTDPTNPVSLLFSWQSADGKTNFPSSGSSLDTEYNWNAGGFAPVLRVTLYPIASDSASITNAALEASSRTYFLYPSAGGSASINYSSTADGSVVPAQCNTSTGKAISGFDSSDYNCNLIINGLQSPGSPQYYYLRLTPIYDSAAVKLEVNTASGRAKFVNVQANVDVTAQAGGSASKRLQARVELNGGGNIVAGGDNLPEQGLRSAEAICKRLQVGPGVVFVDGQVCANQLSVSQPPPVLPTVDAPTATNITDTTATLNSNIVSNGLSGITYYFDYGTTASYGTQTPTQTLAADGPVSADITGLSASTSYYLEICYSWTVPVVGGTSSNCIPGANFTTANPAPPPPPPAFLTHFDWTDDPSAGGPGACAARYGNSTSPDNCYDYAGQYLGANGPCTLTIITYADGTSGGAPGVFSPSVNGGGTTVGNGKPANATLNCGTNTLSLNETSTPPPNTVTTTISYPTGNSFNLNNQYWMIFGGQTITPQQPNDCRDGVHTFIVCFDLTASESVGGGGPDYTKIQFCNIFSNGTFVTTAYNGPAGTIHWSSQGHWIYYTLGYSYSSPTTAPNNAYPSPYTILGWPANPLTNISVTCYDYNNDPGAASIQVGWESCGGRGQYGQYFTDTSNNNCSTNPPGN